MFEICEIFTFLSENKTKQMPKIIAKDKQSVIFQIRMKPFSTWIEC